MKKIFVFFSFVLAVGFYSCNQQSSNKMPEDSTADTAILKENERVDNNTAISNDANAETDLSMDEWNGVNRNMPTIRLPEISILDLELRGDDNYTAYSIDETVLFDASKSEIKAGAKESLQQVAASISKRSKGNIRIYGHTDASGSKEANKELSEKRAQAVKQWLVNNGNIDESRISIHPMGESQPQASNQTEKGKQKNRRVEIVTMTNARQTNNK